MVGPARRLVWCIGDYPRERGRHKSKRVNSLHVNKYHIKRPDALFCLTNRFTMTIVLRFGFDIVDHLKNNFIKETTDGGRLRRK